eukprot:Awhi_evm1s10645
MQRTEEQERGGRGIKEYKEATNYLSCFCNDDDDDNDVAAAAAAAAVNVGMEPKRERNQQGNNNISKKIFR